MLTRSLAPSELETYQILDQVSFLSVSESQAHTSVVMVNHSVQIGEAPVVIEAAFEMGRQRAKRRSSIALIRRPIGLKAVDTDFGGLMQVPTRFGPERLYVAVVASCLAAKQPVPTCSSRLVEGHRRIRCRNGELIELQSCKLGGNEVVIRTDVRQIRKTMRSGNGKL